MMESNRNIHFLDVTYRYQPETGLPIQIHQSPSPELRDLSKRYKDLIWYSGRLCGNSPLNFIGSGILADLRDEFRKQFSAEEHPLPDAFEWPIIHLKDIPVQFCVEKKREFIDVKDDKGNVVGVPHVLFKQGCGKTAGLVTEGNLAGLLLDTKSLGNAFITYKPEDLDAMTISRLCNNMALTQSSPYTADITTGGLTGITFTPENQDYLLGINDQLYEKFDEQKKYRTAVQAIKVLCEKRGIPFDAKRFNY